jgi:hypothetical protein
MPNTEYISTEYDNDNVSFDGNDDINNTTWNQMQNINLHWFPNASNKIVLKGGKPPTQRVEVHYDENGNFTKTKDAKHRNVPAYASNKVGQRIRNAVTNAITPHVVGSKDEMLYFKVSNVNAPKESEPQTLFYNSPYEYVSHIAQNVLENDYIEEWYAKNTKLVGAAPPILNEATVVK